MKERKLDFVVIGAQKAGTTCLYYYLRQHPELYLPFAKEAPFFDRDTRYQKGWQWCTDTFFTHARPHQLWGTVTPSYLGDKRVPGRLYEHNPECKIVVLLRDPVERALSHYRMSVRRGVENRSFTTVLDEKLAQASLSHDRDLTGENQSFNAYRYVVLGEYPRLLNAYYHTFPRDKILVLFSSELYRRPRETLIRLFSFLEVDTLPAHNIVCERSGSIMQSVIRICAHLLLKIKPAFVMKRINIKEGLMIRKEAPNKQRILPSSLISEYDLSRLHNHYSQYEQELEEIIKKSLPWRVSYRDPEIGN